MEKEDQRNFIIAMILMFGMVWAYNAFILEPDQRRRAEAQKAAEAERVLVEAQTPAVTLAESVEDALQSSDRIVFDADSVDGSIRLAGARIDDLNLKRHYLTTEREEELRLFRPERSQNGYYAAWDWRTDQGVFITDGNDTWTQIEGRTLATGVPVTVVLEKDGLRFQREIAVDENYMFTFTDTVTNNSGERRSISAYGSVRRHGPYREFLATTDPAQKSAAVAGQAFQGFIGVINGTLSLRNYKGLFEGKNIKDAPLSEEPGWAGLTDKYWMGALVPDPERSFIVDARLIPGATSPILEIRTAGAAIPLSPGQSVTVTNRTFAGAKELSVLRGYEEGLGVPRFDDAVDWGLLFFLTKPFFSVLIWLEGLLGSFGLAILAFTVMVKIVLFPLYNKSYASMAKMRKLTEPMKEISEKYKDDPQAKQQAMMELYRREKANPVAGCLPILATIPIFFALYKTLVVTLEMRHEPFLYLKDLSVPDPTAIGNLFGLLPWSAELVKNIPILGLVIGIGFLPILYGITMLIVQSLSPPPPDPMQRKIMMFLPIIFTFLFAGFASGLVVYWVWNNVLSTAQQYVIMRRNGVETEFDKLIGRLLGKAKPET